MGNIAILITAFNRPNYLQQCLASVKAADLSQVSTVLVVDDASTDPETRRLIDEFELEGVELIKAFSKENRSIKGSLLFGLDLLFNSCDVCMNLDGDAIVRPDFVKVLMNLHERFPDHISTGFNCVTKNKDGSTRHKILGEGDGCNWKGSIGGINMLFGKKQYGEWVRPSLVECLSKGGNWDHKSCLRSTASGKFIICAVPSVVQHLGVGKGNSSMGHDAGGEPADEAEDFEYASVMTRIVLHTATNKKLYLPKVTLICADGFNVERCIHAANISCRDIEFGAVKILSHLPSDDPRVIPIRPLLSKVDYSIFLLKEIVDYVDSPYFMTIQGDGYIIRAESWDNSWLDYDYIGSPWEWYNDGMNVGNGAASLRSKRLHQVLKEDPTIVPVNDSLIKEYQEDHVIARIYRKYLETNYDIKFAPIEVARKFGIEAWNVKPPGNKYSGQFCFHGRHVDFSGANISHIPY